VDRDVAHNGQREWRVAKHRPVAFGIWVLVLQLGRVPFSRAYPKLVMSTPEYAALFRSNA